MKYRKKPVVIEAFKYDGDFKYSNGEYYIPKWGIDAERDGTLYFSDEGVLKVKTLEGDMTANVGDYIIQGVNGELYPCKPDIFEKTYDLIEESKEKPNKVPNIYTLTTSLLCNKRVDKVVSDLCTYELAQLIESAEEENEFVLFETVSGVEIAVRATDIVCFVRVVE